MKVAYVNALLLLLAFSVAQAETFVRHEVPIEGTEYMAIVILPDGHQPPNSTRIDSRIVKGSVAAQDEFPSIALFKPGGYMCGATVLNKRTAITAAHCCEGKIKCRIRFF